MSSMKNSAEGMKKTLSSLKKKAMNIPHLVTQGEVLGIIWMISLSVHDDSIWQRSTSINDQMFNGRNFKEYFQ